jgi:hypothetical protein
MTVAELIAELGRHPSDAQAVIDDADTRGHFDEPGWLLPVLQVSAVDGKVVLRGDYFT